jgi:magnesium transporter
MDQTPTSPILSAEDLREAWSLASSEDRIHGFVQLPPDEAQAFFLTLSAREQAELVLGIGVNARRLWLRLLAPDDLADVVQQVEPEERAGLLALVDEPTRAETIGLLAYAEDAAGGLMNPRFARLRPEMTMDEAISYLRRQARRELETIYYVYVLDREQRLLGVVSFRELFSAPPERTVREVMSEDVVTVPEEMDQEEVARLIADHDLLAVPVVDAERRIRGIITVDDIFDVVEEEATEDIQKLGGMEALDLPYLETSFLGLLKKRAGWLSVLFLGELMTASAMGRFQDEIARAVVLALFVPLIISSGGNSGSQAATLIIRAMALGEVRLRDWWRIMRREVLAGIALGAILAVLGMTRIAVWQSLFHTYGEHWLLVGFTVAASLVGVVLWGTVSGSMLPFVIHRLGADPASASAPLVATLVDVLGLVIYFEVARAVLGGTLL